MKDDLRKMANAERTASNKRRQQINKEERSKVKGRREINTINNISPKAEASIKPESTKKEQARRKENAKWKQKRHDRYQKRVWPGWRTSEPPGKIVTYNISDSQTNDHATSKTQPNKSK